MIEGRDTLIKFETSVLCLYLYVLIFFKTFAFISILDVKVKRVSPYICRCYSLDKEINLYNY